MFLTVFEHKMPVACTITNTVITSMVKGWENDCPFIFCLSLSLSLSLSLWHTVSFHLSSLSDPRSVSLFLQSFFPFPCPSLSLSHLYLSQTGVLSLSLFLSPSLSISQFFCHSLCSLSNHHQVLSLTVTNYFSPMHFKLMDINFRQPRRLSTPFSFT